MDLQIIIIAWDDALVLEMKKKKINFYWHDVSWFEESTCKWIIFGWFAFFSLFKIKYIEDKFFKFVIHMVTFKHVGFFSSGAYQKVFWKMFKVFSQSVDVFSDRKRSDFREAFLDIPLKFATSKVHSEDAYSFVKVSSWMRNSDSYQIEYEVLGHCHGKFT